ncbi:actin cytoskeleton-regulatory complex protein PAN1-like [Micropterus dolomieu]|uniref:actin cytoskeleton-regulatory complex protein PAN1-like n=1 Tax=Micropterus dolomieu TaxID=147949 RepID=UPI001E8E9C4F|nr:actin cytoskeleton-regulatory complex protein PAN1-like [Micropterus dolomieu]
MNLLVVIWCFTVLCSSLPVSEAKKRVKRSDDSDEMYYMQPQFQPFPVPIPVPFPGPFVFPFAIPPVPPQVIPPPFIFPPVIPPIGK